MVTLEGKKKKNQHLAKVTVASTSRPGRQNSYSQPSVNVPLVKRSKEREQRLIRKQGRRLHRRRGETIVWLRGETETAGVSSSVGAGRLLLLYRPKKYIILFKISACATYGLIAAVAQRQSQRLVIWRSLVGFPGQETEPQTAPDDQWYQRPFSDEVAGSIHST